MILVNSWVYRQPCNKKVAFSYQRYAAGGKGGFFCKSQAYIKVSDEPGKKINGITVIPYTVHTYPNSNPNPNSNSNPNPKLKGTLGIPE